MQKNWWFASVGPCPAGCRATHGGMEPMAQKQHPLEVFRKHGTFAKKTNRSSGGKASKAENSSSQSASSRNASSRGDDASGRSSRKTSDAAGAGKGRAAAGRRESRTAARESRNGIYLNRNGLLGLLLVTVILSLGMFYLGFHRGVGSASKDPGGSDGVLLREDVENRSETNRSEAGRSEAGRSDMGSELVKRWGVQACTWKKKSYEIARQADIWLKEKGYNSRLYPLQDGTTYTIIVGSFLDKNDPELERLKQSLREIDDYPHGSRSPFNDARILDYSVKKQSRS